MNATYHGGSGCFGQTGGLVVAGRFLFSGGTEEFKAG